MLPQASMAESRLPTPHAGRTVCKGCPLLRRGRRPCAIAAAWPPLPIADAAARLRQVLMRRQGCDKPLCTKCACSVASVRAFRAKGLVGARRPRADSSGADGRAALGAGFVWGELQLAAPGPGSKLMLAQALAAEVQGLLSFWATFCAICASSGASVHAAAAEPFLAVARLAESSGADGRSTLGAGFLDARLALWAGACAVGVVATRHSVRFCRSEKHVAAVASFIAEIFAFWHFADMHAIGTDPMAARRRVLQAAVGAEVSGTRTAVRADVTPMWDLFAPPFAGSKAMRPQAVVAERSPALPVRAWSVAQVHAFRAQGLVGASPPRTERSGAGGRAALIAELFWFSAAAAG